MTEKSDILEAAKILVEMGQWEAARLSLRSALDPDTDRTCLARIARWVRKTEWPNLRPIRAAFLGGGTLEHLLESMDFWLRLEGFCLDAYLPLYDTWRMESFNPESGLTRFKPDLVWFFTHWRDMRIVPKWEATALQAEKMTDSLLAEFKSYWRAIRENLPGVQIFQNNSDPAPERIFGNFEAMLPGGRSGLLRAFNNRLPAVAADAGVLLFDLDRLAAQAGLDQWNDPAYWRHSKHPFNPRLAWAVTFQAAKFLAATRGAAKKVVVLDLDNTLWGGVIGDDGLAGIELEGNGPTGEAFTAFQAYLKELAGRGLLLAVASKNELETAREPFLKHSGMRLGLDDFAAFKADWNNKADNIRRIAAELNLGLDTFVFIDDNPAERALVRAELPMVTVPEMPVDPDLFIPYLSRLALFETASFSEEDQHRGSMYKSEALRREAFVQATDLNQYLASLEMTASSGAADEIHLPRMAQLINKSNQFHPTTTRYTEDQLRAMAADGCHLLRWFSLADRFGDHGLVSIVILRREDRALCIDTWVMSCRVLERGFEEFILRELITLGLAEKATELRGRYLPTSKNGVVAQLYPKLGFSHEEDLDIWRLPLPTDRMERPLYITRKGNDI